MWIPLLLFLAQAPPDLAAERALAARVDDLRARDTVRTLVAFGPRMGGTPSGERSSAWLAERFRAMGLLVHLREDPPRRCHFEDHWNLTVHIGEGDAREEFVLERAYPFGFSPSVRGSASLALEPREGGVWLSSKRTRPPASGPRPALCLVDGMTTRDGEWPLCRTVGGKKPVPVFGISRAEGAHLRELLEKGQKVTVDFELQATIREASPRTVVAVLQARDGAPKGHLLFCAHGDSDSGGPGANDNGSGEAIVLEIARVWSAAVKEGSLPAPEREVRFAIWGSEIHSTAAYLAQYAEDADSPVLAVLNYDQAGFGASSQQLNVEPDDLQANVELVRLCAAVLRDHAGEEGFPPRWATNKSLGGTDSYVFSNSAVFRREKRPALTLYTSAWDKPDEKPKTPGMPGESWSDRDRVSIDFDPFYHSAGDRPELTTDREPENCGWCARVGLLVGLRWLARN